MFCLISGLEGLWGLGKPRRDDPRTRAKQILDIFKPVAVAEIAAEKAAWQKQKEEDQLRVAA